MSLYVKLTRGQCDSLFLLHLGTRRSDLNVPVACGFCFAELGGEEREPVSSLHGRQPLYSLDSGRFSWIIVSSFTVYTLEPFPETTSGVL